MKIKRYMKEPLLVTGFLFTFLTIGVGVKLGYDVSQLLSSEEGHQETGELVEVKKEYTLPNHATSIQKNYFEELKVVTESYHEFPTELNEQSYVSCIVKNFITDFYTLSTKENRYDVGGIQYIHPTYRAEFKTQAVDGFYLYLNQLEPEEKAMTVASVKVDTATQIDYQALEAQDAELTVGLAAENEGELEEETLESTFPIVWEVTANWVFESTTDNEIESYMNEATFILAKHENKWEIVSIQVVEQDEIGMLGERGEFIG